MAFKTFQIFSVGPQFPMGEVGWRKFLQRIVVVESLPFCPAAKWMQFGCWKHREPRELDLLHPFLVTSHPVGWWPHSKSPTNN